MKAKERETIISLRVCCALDTNSYGSDLRVGKWGWKKEHWIIVKSTGFLRSDAWSIISESRYISTHDTYRNGNSDRTHFHFRFQFIRHSLKKKTNYFPTTYNICARWSVTFIFAVSRQRQRQHMPIHSISCAIWIIWLLLESRPMQYVYRTYAGAAYKLYHQISTCDFDETNMFFRRITYRFNSRQFFMLR